jgi:hypothetical protein
MSERSSDSDASDAGMSVGDDELPEDLRPSEDNPLAQPAGDDVPDDILKETSGGRSSDESDGGSDEKSDGGSDDDPDDPDDPDAATH